MQAEIIHIDHLGQVIRQLVGFTRNPLRYQINVKRLAQQKNVQTDPLEMLEPGAATMKKEEHVQGIALSNHPKSAQEITKQKKQATESGNSRHMEDLTP
jgi:hypothetical protein